MTHPFPIADCFASARLMVVPAQAGKRLSRRVMAPCRALSYFAIPADRQQIQNPSDGLSHLNFIESLPSTDAKSREHLERCSSFNHRRKRYACLRTGRARCLRTDSTRNECFTDACCQSLSFAICALSFAICARRHWLSLTSNASFHQIPPPDRLAGHGVGT